MSLRFRIGPFTFGKNGMRLSLWNGGSGFSIPIFNRKSQSYGKIKFGMFSYFFSSKAKSYKKPEIEKNTIGNSKPNYQNIIKKNHSQAYEPWTKEADEKLKLQFRQGKNIKELSEIFGRTKGAIRARIEKIC